jgi:hypothetical protein
MSRLKLKEGKRELNLDFVLGSFGGFVKRHIGYGHEITMCLHPEGNGLLIFCETCDPESGFDLPLQHRLRFP